MYVVIFLAGKSAIGQQSQRRGSQVGWLRVGHRGPGRSTSVVWQVYIIFISVYAVDGNVLFVIDRKPDCRFCRNTGLPVPRSTEERTLRETRRYMGMRLVHESHRLFHRCILSNIYATLYALIHRCNTLHIVGWIPTVLGRRST